MSQVRVFISHASADRELAKKLAFLIRDTCGLGYEEIRCTSVPQFALEPGDVVESRLRSEIEHCDAVLAILTRISTASVFVLYELGAGWGLQKLVVPILGPAVTPSDFQGPLREVNPVVWNNRDHWLALIDRLVKAMKVPYPSIRVVMEQVDGIIAIPAEPVMPAAISASPEPLPSSVKAAQLLPCSSESTLLTTSWETPTTIAFENRRNTNIRLYWLNKSGEREFLVTIASGRSVTQQTWLTHVFVVTDMANHCLGIYLPEPEPTRAIIE